MYLVYQKRESKSGRRKRGKDLESIQVHVMDDDRCLCGVSPNQMKRHDPYSDSVTLVPGVVLYKLTDEQAIAWVASAKGSGSFNLDLCWTCFESIKTMMKYRENLELPGVIEELVIPSTVKELVA